MAALLEAARGAGLAIPNSLGAPGPDLRTWEATPTPTPGIGSYLGKGSDWTLILSHEISFQ